MWEKIRGLISIVVLVCVCRATAREDVNVRMRARGLAVHERLIVTILHPMREDGTSSASARTGKKRV